MDNQINELDGTSSGNYVGHEHSWKEMGEHLYYDISRLFDRQSLLMKTEIKEKIDAAKMGLGSMLIGGGVLVLGFFTAVATAIIVLDLILPLWAAALIMTSAMLIVGGVMVMGAKKKLQGDQLVPTQSLETLGEIKSTFKERFNELRTYEHH
jgi:hypothetical protein